MKWSFAHLNLRFRFPAGTSRGVLNTRDSYILRVESDDAIGYGECAPLPGLSTDYGSPEEMGKAILSCVSSLKDYPPPQSASEPFRYAFEAAAAFPSVRFGLETALLSLFHKETFTSFPVAEMAEEFAIPINGLVWMGDFETMRNRLSQKVEEGFQCIKIKVGAIDFEQELELLREIITINKNLLIRVDANGAFTDNVEQVLDRLAEFPIEYLEQPIKAGNWKKMAEICGSSPIPIALDEELIANEEEKVELLEVIKPSVVIIKPTLLGGFRESIDWIRLAGDRGIRHVVTSALESSIGLNAIAQFVAQDSDEIVHGLGTGQLFENNIPSPMYISEGYLRYDNGRKWEVEGILNWQEI